MVVLTVTVNAVWRMEGTACRWGFLSAAAAFIATKHWQREPCKQLAPCNSTRRGGWLHFEPEPTDNRSHESSNKHRVEANPSLTSAGLQQIMCLGETAMLEMKLNSLPSHFTRQHSRELSSHTTPGKNHCFSERPTV